MSQKDPSKLIQESFPHYIQTNFRDGLQKHIDLFATPINDAESVNMYNKRVEDFWKNANQVSRGRYEDMIAVLTTGKDNQTYRTFLRICNGKDERDSVSFILAKCLDKYKLPADVDRKEVKKFIFFLASSKT